MSDKESAFEVLLDNNCVNTEKKRPALTTQSRAERSRRILTGELGFMGRNQSQPQPQQQQQQRASIPNPLGRSHPLHPSNKWRYQSQQHAPPPTLSDKPWYSLSRTRDHIHNNNNNNLYPQHEQPSSPLRQRNRPYNLYNLSSSKSRSQQPRQRQRQSNSSRRRFVRKSKTKYSSASNSDDDDDNSFLRQNRKRRFKSFNAARYDMSEDDTDDDSDAGNRSRHSVLNARQKKMVLDTIKEYVPENMKNMVYEDLIAQMEQNERQGFQLPKGYDKRKHTMEENEIRLYEQQLQRDKSRDQKKMSYMLNFSALGLSWFCQCISVDWIKTKHLPQVIRESLEEGEFDDCLEGIGMYLRGTVFDNPVFSTLLKFVEKVGEAHHQEMKEEEDKLEEEEERKDRRHRMQLHQLNQLREDKKTDSFHDLRRKRTTKLKQQQQQQQQPLDEKKKSEQSVKQDIKKTTPAPTQTTKKTKVKKQSSPTPQSQKTNQVSRSQSKSTSNPPKKKKKGFKKIPGLAMPKNVGKMMQGLQAPMVEMKNMMDVDIEVDVQDAENLNQRFDLSL